MLTLLMAMTIASPALAADIPPGTDVAIRAELGQLTPEARKIWKDVEPLLRAWPTAKHLTESATDTWQDILAILSERLGVDLTRRGSQLTATLDLDAAGGMVFGCVVRGAIGKPPQTPDETDELETFEVDGQPAFRLVDHNMSWSVVNRTTLVLGNQRGLQRQLRQVLRQKHPRASAGDAPEIIKLAQRLRGSAPMTAVFVIPASMRHGLAVLWSTAGPLIARVRSATLLAKPREMTLHLSSNNDDDQKAVEHGVKALLALFRASTSLLQAGGEVLLGLELLDQRPPMVPKALTEERIKTLLTSWIDGATLDAKVRNRPHHVTEAVLKPSGYRPLLASLAMMAIMMLPSSSSQGRLQASAMLMALRKAELAHKKSSGEFVACGPVPKQLPHGPVPWPEQSCFDAIGFHPTKKVYFQLGAAVSDGKLLMMARGDTNGDGIAEVWVLNDTAADVTAFMPPKGATKPPF